MLKRNQAVIGIFVVALVVRVAFILAWGGGEDFYDSHFDQFIYVDIAKNIVSGYGFSTSFDVFVAKAFAPTAIEPPLYPIFLAATFQVFGQNLLIVRLLQAFIGSLMVFTAFFTGKKVTDRTVATVAAFIVAVYPLFVMYSRPIITDLIYSFFISALVLLFAYFVTGTFRIIHFILWGVLVGIAFLIRPEVLLFAPLIGPFAVYWAVKSTPSGKQHAAWKAIGNCVLAALTFFVVISPWATRNWQSFGEPLIFPTKSWGWWEQNWLRYNEETSSDWIANCNRESFLECTHPDFENLSELTRDRAAGKLGTDFIIQHPLIYARYGLSRVLISFPVIPRESLPPPVGYLGVRQRPDDGLDMTALDDFPLYLNPVEKLRVWTFRILLLLAVAGLVLAVKQRNWAAIIVFGIPVSVHVGSAFFLHGAERMRMTIDICLILLASYAVVSIYRTSVQKKFALQKPLPLVSPK
ncbi:MAG: phospholipid carrier-dependent glycosyltransferase [Chloroflexi bacterium]|nr:MAG: phospholipid carrier-dependent glycosyltransferase [Chloroflexota bacterium]